ncbi:NYN domain-containing protein [Allobacillus sp. GCM10007491]|uniref:NYN domain-containing protein n=1 Tax=Allobacillus saliphilus TaxID=2912308 RepID=A0A941CVE4_9BACI|nr:NYN domain-containing protein [Allobacillus saliphilus]MBR7553821.1 NYN domain-containing protein [Allobacillus saliphilus]
MIVLIVDGYNMIGDWPVLKKLKEKSLEEARAKLVELLAEFQAYMDYRIIVIFDAYNVKGPESRETFKKVQLIYTKENETADEAIEKLIKEVKNVKTKVYVATSDFQEQWTVFSQGALRKSARELFLEIQRMEKDIQIDLANNQKLAPKHKILLDQDLRSKFEEMRRGRK